MIGANCLFIFCLFHINWRQIYLQHTIPSYNYPHNFSCHQYTSSCPYTWCNCIFRNQVQNNLPHTFYHNTTYYRNNFRDTRLDIPFDSDRHSSRERIPSPYSASIADTRQWCFLGVADTLDTHSVVCCSVGWKKEKVVLKCWIIFLLT